jgi:hypothetical protein
MSSEGAQCYFLARGSLCNQAVARAACYSCHTDATQRQLTDDTWRLLFAMTAEYLFPQRYAPSPGEISVGLFTSELSRHYRNRPCLLEVLRNEEWLLRVIARLNF